MPEGDRFHINPETGLPNLCLDGDGCTFGGDAFHYATKHDARVAWQARQLERGIIAYRAVMQAKEKQEQQDTLARIAGKAEGISKKLSWSVVRLVVVRNISKYVVNFLGVFMAYAVASGEWLKEDWIRRFLPTIATVVLVALVIWFVLKFAKGGTKAARAVRTRRIKRAVAKVPPNRPHA